MSTSQLVDTKARKPIKPPYVRRTAAKLPRLFTFDQPVGPTGEATDGVSISAFGLGQVSGVMYTVPAHSELNIHIDFHMICVTPDDVKALDSLIRSLLDASHQHVYDDLQKTDVSGGLSFFGFFGGGVSASYSDTKHTMDSWGLSEANQQTIVKAMMDLSQKTSDFGFDGPIYNQDYDYSVSGNVFGIVMDATIAQGGSSNQVRLLAPQPQFQSPSGEGRPVIGKFY